MPKSWVGNVIPGMFITLLVLFQTKDTWILFLKNKFTYVDEIVTLPEKNVTLVS